MRVRDNSKARVRRQETLGILLIGVFFLLVFLVRYGRHIPWSAR